MSKDTKILDYAKYVENQKDRLYEHCRENNIKVNKNSSLDKIVSMNNLVNNPTNENKIRVRVFDYDGELLDTQYYNLGETIPEPEPPTPKDDRLVFKKWIKAVDSLIAERDFDFGALYECNITKEVDGNVCKVNIIDCVIDEEYTGLDVSIPIYSYYYKTCIDWGDGSEVSEITANGTTKVAHTYAKNGNYSILIYGYNTRDTFHFYFATNTSSCLLGSRNANRAIKKIIFNGTFTRTSDYLFYWCVNLESCILPMKILSSDTRDSIYFERCYSLKSIILPDIEYGDFRIVGINAPSLKIVILPSTCKEMTIPLSNIKLDIVYPENIEVVGNMTVSNIKRLQLKLKSSSVPSIEFLSNVELIDLYESECYDMGSYSDFKYCINLKELILPKNLTKFDVALAFDGCKNLKHLVIPDSVIQITVFSDNCRIEDLTIPNQWSNNIDFIKFYTLSVNSWISIANRIKDLNGENSKVINMYGVYYIKLKDIYLNSFGVQVDKDTEGAINILDFIRNKNWTISIIN